jgi:NNP family nitrate/nitrite transporter-like MFS transporter
VLAGPLSDRLGGARVTQAAGIGLLLCAIGVTFFTEPASMADFPWFVAFMLGLFFFAGVGNASTFKQMPMLFPPRQAAGIIGWTSAVAAYGPFAAGMLMGLSVAWFGTPSAFFYWAVIFYAVCIGINWWYYARKGAEAPC